MAPAITFVSVVAFLFFCLWMVARGRAKDALHQRTTLEMQRDNVEAQNAAILANNERLAKENAYLRNRLTPPPSPREETPGLQAAMQAAVDDAKADNGQEVYRLREGDRKFPHVGHADVIVEDGRVDSRMAKQAEIDELPRTLQGTTADRETGEPKLRPSAFTGEVLTSPTRRAKIDAQIRKEALEEAVAMLPPEKVAELRAEGGEAAVEAFVAPAVNAVMDRLGEAAIADAATMLASPSNIRQTWDLGEPKRKPSSLEANQEANKRLARGLLGPEPGSAQPQAVTPVDPLPTNTAETPAEVVASN